MPKDELNDLYKETLRRLAGDLNAAQWPVGFDEALKGARKEAEKAHGAELARTGSPEQAAETYHATFRGAYDRLRVRGKG